MNFKFLFRFEFLKYYYNKSNYRNIDYKYKRKEVILLGFVNKRFVFRWIFYLGEKKSLIFLESIY